MDQWVSALSTYQIRERFENEPEDLLTVHTIGRDIDFKIVHDLNVDTMDHGQ